MIVIPYHVRITRRSDRASDEISLDLTEEQLETRFLALYREGRPIVVGGVTIPAGDIERIRITYTEETSEQLLPIVRAERRSSSWIAGGIPDEWYVAERGRDVTDDLITGPPGGGAETRASARSTTRNPRDIFVIHGRDSNARDALFTFLRAVDLHPIEWSQAVAATGSSTPYIGEVLEMAFSLAQAVVVLMTPDDEARLRESFRQSDDPAYEAQLTPQARPNVLFEAGMSMGRFPNRTILVQLGSLRPFSDIGGRHVIRLNNTVERRQELAQRLQDAGCSVNLTGTDWHTEGNFSSYE